MRLHLRFFCVPLLLHVIRVVVATIYTKNRTHGTCTGQICFPSYIPDLVEDHIIGIAPFTSLPDQSQGNVREMSWNDL